MKSDILTSIFSSTSAGICSSSKSISGKYLRRAFIAASLTRAEISAPTKPWVLSNNQSISKSSLIGIPRVWIPIISARPFLSGTPISNSRSNLPPRRRAGSIASGRLVAPITMTLSLPCIPSSKVNNCATTLLSTSPLTSSLLGAIESNSSIKIIAGELAAASSNISRNCFSLSP